MYTNRTNKNAIFVIISIVLFLIPLLTIPVHALDVPSPTGFVTDTTNTLSSQERMQLETQLSALEQNTTAEVAILIIPSLNGEVLEEYSTKIFREWGIGKQDVNNGILILVAKDDRKVRIEVGYGLEGSVTDLQSGMIIRNKIAPAFKQEKYFEGLQFAVDDISGLIKEDPTTMSTYEQHPTMREMSFASIIFLSFMTFLIVMAIKRKRKFLKAWRWTFGGWLVASIIGFIISLYVGLYATIGCFILLIIALIIAANVIAAISGGKEGMFIGGFGGFGGGGSSGGGGGFGGFGGGSSGGGGGSGGW